MPASRFLHANPPRSSTVRATAAVVLRLVAALLPFLVIAPVAQAQSAQSVSGARTAVVLVGGIYSSLHDGSWSLLTNRLQRVNGYQEQDFLPFSYSVMNFDTSQQQYVPGDYQVQSTCEDMGSSEASLVWMLHQIRDLHWADHVVLVGHSLGGVLAFDGLSQSPDLVAGSLPFVRGIVMFDSPLGGLSGIQLDLGALEWGSCLPLRQMYARHTDSQQVFLRTNTGNLLSNGLLVRTIVNDHDLLLSPWEQSIADEPVNFEVNVPGGSAHLAALYDSATIAQVATLFPPQGS